KAQRLSDPFWMAGNLLGEAALHCQLRDSRSALKRAEQLFSIASEHGMSYITTLAAFFHGWALADQGRGQEGIAEMLRNFPRTGGWDAELAESFGKNEQPEEGLAVVARGLREAERSGERTFWARLYGIQGDLLLMRDSADKAQAERSFRT